MNREKLNVKAARLVSLWKDILLRCLINFYRFVSRKYEKQRQAKNYSAVSLIGVNLNIQFLAWGRSSVPVRERKCEPERGARKRYDLRKTLIGWRFMNEGKLEASQALRCIAKPHASGPRRRNFASREPKRAKPVSRWKLLVPVTCQTEHSNVFPAVERNFSLIVKLVGQLVPVN